LSFLLALPPPCPCGHRRCLLHIPWSWVGLCRVILGCRVENHGPRPTRHTCGSSLIGFRGFRYNFRVGSGRVYRVGQPKIRYTPPPPSCVPLLPPSTPSVGRLLPKLAINSLYVPTTEVLSSPRHHDPRRRASRPCPNASPRASPHACLKIASACHVWRVGGEIWQAVSSASTSP
jgi:hypothetical protein